jgi:hypothetical protein
MAENRNPFQNFPTSLKQSTQNPNAVYSLLTEYYSVKGVPKPEARSASASAQHEPPVQTLSGDDGLTIQIYKGVPARTRSTAGASDRASTITPVYSTGASGSLAVPTGRILVRFDDDVNADSKKAELKKAGYKIAQILSYAPNAAWLEASSGGVTSALSNIKKLEQLANVQNVEPQFLSARAAR